VHCKREKKNELKLVNYSQKLAKLWAKPSPKKKKLKTVKQSDKMANNGLMGVKNGQTSYNLLNHIQNG